MANNQSITKQNKQNKQNSKQDINLIKSSLRKLSLKHNFKRIAVILITLILWGCAAFSIYYFGDKINYAKMPIDGAISNFLKEINIYIIWVLIALVSLIFIIFINSWLNNQKYYANHRIADHAILRDLIPKLSASGKDTLGWVWQKRDNPICIHHLEKTIDELKSNRSTKINMVREQEQLLKGTSQATSLNNMQPLESDAKQEPVLTVAATSPAVAVAVAPEVALVKPNEDIEHIETTENNDNNVNIKDITTNVASTATLANTPSVTESKIEQKTEQNNPTITTNAPLFLRND